MCCDRRTDNYLSHGICPFEFYNLEAVYLGTYVCTSAGAKWAWNSVRDQQDSPAAC